MERSAVQKLEVRRREGKRLKGAYAGFLAGTLIGAVASAANHGSTYCDSNSLSACDLTASAVLLGLPGAAIGAMVAPGEQWETVSERGGDAGVRVQVVPLLGPGKRGAAISVSFR